MRFSVLHLLLLGIAFAAPIHDATERRVSVSETHSLIARGLVPILERSPAVTPLKPEPVAPKPRPDAPGTPNEPPPPIRPNDPANPTSPGDDTPGLIPSDPNTNPVNAPDTPVVQPVEPGAPQPNRPGTSKDTPEALPVAEDSVWAQKGIEKNHIKGYQAQKKLDEAIEGNIPDKGFKGDLNVKYKAASNAPTSGEMPKGKYLQDSRWNGAFDFTQEGAAVSHVRNSDAQIQELEAWVMKDVKPKKIEEDPFKTTDEIDAELNMQLDYYKEQDMLFTMENPKKGGMIIKDSANKENDLFRGEGSFAGDPNFPQPPFGGGKGESIGWTDQTMAQWRAAVAKTPGAKVTDLRFMARDAIVTPESQDVLRAVQQQMKKVSGEGYTVRRTGGDTAEQAGFDAIASTVHGQRPIQMLADHHVEMGGLKVNAFHVDSVKGPPAGWNMVIEFGH